MRCNGGVLQLHAAIGLDQNPGLTRLCRVVARRSGFLPPIWPRLKSTCWGAKNADRRLLRLTFALQGKNGFPVRPKRIAAHLLASIMAGLPGAYTRYSIDGLQKALGEYQGISRADLRANFARFLAEVIPTADELGMRMCVHPDDPPRDILGLPRVVSNEEDIAWILAQQDCLANGLTLCSGSLGANPSKRLCLQLPAGSLIASTLHICVMLGGSQTALFRRRHILMVIRIW